MDNEQFERLYTSRELTSSFQITGSTLRKWCLQLETLGYTFRRNENNQREFSELDRDVLQKLKWDIDAGLTIENASRSVLTRIGRVPVTNSVPDENTAFPVDPRSSRVPAQLSLKEFRQILIDDFRQVVREEIAVALKTQQTPLQLPAVEEAIATHINAVNENINETQRLMMEQLQVQRQAHELIAKQQSQVALAIESMEKSQDDQLFQIYHKFMDAQKEISEKMDAVINETRSERHKKRGLFARLFGSKIKS